MPKTTKIIFLLLFTASIALNLILFLVLPSDAPPEPPDESLTAALQQLQDQTEINNRAQNQKIQTALDQQNQTNQSIQNLTDQVTALSQQNQNLTRQLLQLQSEFADPNSPQITLPPPRIPVTYDPNSVIPPASTTTNQANTGKVNKNIEEIIVFITKSGKKYHRPDCSSLSKSKIPLTLNEAIARGYTPCTRCKPPGS